MLYVIDSLHAIEPAFRPCFFWEVIAFKYLTGFRTVYKSSKPCTVNGFPFFGYSSFVYIVRTNIFVQVIKHGYFTSLVLHPNHNNYTLI